LWQAQDEDSQDEDSDEMRDDTVMTYSPFFTIPVGNFRHNSWSAHLGAANFADK
jgi:hypothetical protein